MRLSTSIHPTADTREHFAVIELHKDDGARLCALDLQYSELARLPRPQAVALDLLLTASSVYAIDKLVLRSTASDAWTRDIQLAVQVSSPELWAGSASQLNQCLSFLTGDNWSIDFSTGTRDPIGRRRAQVRRRRSRVFTPPIRAAAVSLFSGGLDSLVGVIDWLEEHPHQPMLLVGHHDGDMAGPFADQKTLLASLTAAYPGRLSSLLVRVGHDTPARTQTEITLRGRSLIFISLGMVAASALGPQVPLLVPENGTIALNVPLTPSRRGSCSTRTAHPSYLAMLGTTLRNLGLSNPISNPLRNKTKGEVLTACRNQALLARIARSAVSCAKRGHKMHWTRRNATSCGRCMPCIYRRAAMHAAGWDDEVYGDDICLGEVDLTDIGEKANDLRACLSFVKLAPSNADVASLLMASGRLEPGGVVSDAAMISRTMDEIRTLLRDKASPAVRRHAGL